MADVKIEPPSEDILNAKVCELRTRFDDDRLSGISVFLMLSSRLDSELARELLALYCCSNVLQ